MSSRAAAPRRVTSRWTRQAPACSSRTITPATSPRFRSPPTAVFTRHRLSRVIPARACTRCVSARPTHTRSSPRPARLARRSRWRADLGIDRVVVYRIDEARGTLTPHEAGSIAAAPGAGPRHLAFTPAGDAVFVINELDSTIASYAWDPARGTLEARGKAVSTLPADFAGENLTAEIAVHPGGAFLYGSNRGHDSIAIFRIGARRRRRRERRRRRPSPDLCRTPRHAGQDAASLRDRSDWRLPDRRQSGFRLARRLSHRSRDRPALRRRRPHARPDAVLRPLLSV